MSSGNFIIGKDLKLKGFEEYVKPVLKKYQVDLTDFLTYKEGLDNKILVSILRDSTPYMLEEIVLNSLKEAAQKVKKAHEDKKPHEEYPSAWEHELVQGYQPCVEIIGVYQENETASKIFQNLAIKYSLKDTSSELKKFESEMKNFSNKFKSF